MVRRHTHFLLAGGLLIASALTACSQASPNTAKTVTVTASDSASTSGSPTPSGTDTGFVNGTNTATGTAGATPSVSTVATLGGVCDDLLPEAVVAQVVGVPLPGKTQFVVGQADPSIERLVYLNCRYGVTTPVKGRPSVAKVEIGLSLYASDIRAQSRVAGTVSDFVALGAKATPTTVNGKPATILTGYKNPTLVVAVGPRTVAVTLQDKVFGAEQTADLVNLAKAALDATANFRK